MKLTILAIAATLVAGNAFANSASVVGRTILSDTRNAPWTTQTNSSGIIAYKQIINDAQADAGAVLAGEEATPMFVKAAQLIEESAGVKFQSNEEAALAIISENSNL